MINEEVQMEKLKPEQAVELLRKKGIEVSLEQAVVILEFLHLLTNITDRTISEKALGLYPTGK